MLRTLLNGNSVFEWPGQLRIDNDGQTVNELKGSGVQRRRLNRSSTLSRASTSWTRPQLRDPTFPGAIGI